jgi:hypothetical protein
MSVNVDGTAAQPDVDVDESRDHLAAGCAAHLRGVSPGLLQGLNASAAVQRGLSRSAAAADDRRGLSGLRPRLRLRTVSDDRDNFFAELQPATLARPDAASALDAEGNDGWCRRAASDEQSAQDSGSPHAAAIAAALSSDRELAPRAPRRRPHRARREQTAAAHPPHSTPRRVAFAEREWRVASGTRRASSPSPPKTCSQSQTPGRLRHIDTGSPSFLSLFAVRG